MRRDILREYQFFKTGTGPYQCSFGSDDEVEEEDTELKNDILMGMSSTKIAKTVKSVRIKDVFKWVEGTGKHMSRLAWFLTWHPESILFLRIAKPLLSLRTSGSMTVERVAKPLKNFVYTKYPHRMSPEQSNILLRTGLNLKFLAQA